MHARVYALGAHHFQDIVATFTRHENVEEQEIGLPVSYLLDRLFAVVRGLGVVPLGIQTPHDHRRKQRVVFTHEDPFCHTPSV